MYTPLALLLFVGLVRAQPVPEDIESPTAPEEVAEREDPLAVCNELEQAASHLLALVAAKHAQATVEVVEDMTAEGVQIPAELVVVEVLVKAEIPKQE